MNAKAETLEKLIQDLCTIREVYTQQLEMRKERISPTAEFLLKHQYLREYSDPDNAAASAQRKGTVIATIQKVENGEQTKTGIPRIPAIMFAGYALFVAHTYIPIERRRNYPQLGELQRFLETIRPNMEQPEVRINAPDGSKTEIRIHDYLLNLAPLFSIEAELVGPRPQAATRNGKPHELDPKQIQEDFRTVVGDLKTIKGLYPPAGFQTLAELLFHQGLSPEALKNMRETILSPLEVSSWDELHKKATAVRTSLRGVRGVAEIGNQAALDKSRS